jgi:tRNA(Ile2) C34 agmatinyltransferase TiaS
LGTEGDEPDTDHGTGEGLDWGKHSEGEHYSKSRPGEYQTKGDGNKSGDEKTNEVERTESTTKHRVHYMQFDRFEWGDKNDTVKKIEPGDTVGGEVKDRKPRIVRTQIIKVEPVYNEQ